MSRRLEISPAAMWLGYATMVCGTAAALFHPVLSHPLPHDFPAVAGLEFGEHARYVRLLYIALHAASALLLARVCRASGMDAAPSLVAGLLFLGSTAHFGAVHALSGLPLQAAFMSAMIFVISFLAY